MIEAEFGDTFVAGRLASVFAEGKDKNPKDNTKEEAGAIIKDNTEARIGMDHDTMSIILSPPFL